MRITPSFFVVAGDLIRAASWNQVGRAIRALQLIAGVGVRLRETANGTIINFDGQAAIFSHPFQVRLVGDEGCTVRWGQINGVEGTIDDKPLLVEEGQETPVLRWDKLKVDSKGRGWVAAEVTCSEKDWSVKSWKIVQVSDLDTDGGQAPEGEAASTSSPGGVPNLPGRRARQPLAMLVQSESGAVVVHQVTYFHLQHRRKAATDDPKADVGRHFFFPKG